MLRAVPWLCPASQGESRFSGPPSSHLRQRGHPCAALLLGFLGEPGKAAPSRAEPRWKGLFVSVTCYLFGSFLVPELTFFVPFFGVREESDHFPTLALSSLHFSSLISLQLPKCPRQALGSSQWWLSLSQGSRLARWAAGTGNSLDGRFPPPTFRCSTTSSLTEHAVSRRFCWVDRGTCVGPLSVVLQCPVVADIGGLPLGTQSLSSLLPGPHNSQPMAGGVDSIPAPSGP